MDVCWARRAGLGRMLVLQQLQLKHGPAWETTCCAAYPWPWQLWHVQACRPPPVAPALLEEPAPAAAAPVQRAQLACPRLLLQEAQVPQVPQVPEVPPAQLQRQ